MKSKMAAVSQVPLYRGYFVAVLIAVAFLIVGILTIGDYGINWDAPFRMMRGQSFMQFFLTGQQTYGEKTRLSPVLISPGEYASHYNPSTSEYGNKAVSLPARPLPLASFRQTISPNQRRSFYQSESWNGKYNLNFDDGHFPLPDDLGALFNKILFQWLGVAGDLESYQIFYLLVGALGVFIVGEFAFDISHSTGSGQAGSVFAAAAASLSLALFPYFLAESHINMKDPVQAVFFAGAVWAFWKQYKTKFKFKWFLIFTAFIVLALGTKWNVIFLPLILIPWLWTIRRTIEFQKWFQVKRLILYGFIFLILTSLFLILTWPFIWFHPLVAMEKVVHFYWSVGINSVPQQPAGWIGALGINFYPLVLVLTQTPEVVLILVSIGLVILFKKKTEVKWLLLLWLVVPIVRQMIPGVWFYNGLRQEMEVLPALAILSGVGFEFMINKFNSIKFSGVSSQSSLIVVVIFIGLLAVPILRYHPNENAYFNVLAGGLVGAEKHKLVDWSLTYGNVYKQGVDWLNHNAEKDANLAHLEGSNFAISYEWLRSDIAVSPYFFSGGEGKGEYIIKPYDSLDFPIFAKRYLEKDLQPVAEIKADGAPLLMIYKNSPEFQRFAWKEERMDVVKPDLVDPENGFVRYDLGREVKVAGIIIQTDRASCSPGTPGTDEIVFVPESKLNEPIDLADAYINNVKKWLDKKTVKYLFPGENARYVVVRTISPLSCLIGGKISSVDYLVN